MSELSIGTLADHRMLTGDHGARRDLLSRIHRSGLDPVFVADHTISFTGIGP